MKMQFPDPPVVRALCSLLVISHHFQTVNAEGFKVIGPDGPVVAVLGGDAELPCRLSPPLSAEHMQVRWFRSRFKSVVHLYENGTDQNERQIPEYRGRTELIRTHISNGSVSLRIHSVRLKDEGSYTCFFQFDTYYEEEATLELKKYRSVEKNVRADALSLSFLPEDVADEPRHIISPEKVVLATTQAVPAEFSTKVPEPVPLDVEEDIAYQVSDVLEVRKRVSERESVISISDAFFRRVSRWVVSLPIILGSGLTFCGLLVALVLYHSRKEHKEKANLSAEVKSLTAELEWRRCCSYAVDVTLDPETAHPQLLLTDEGKTVKYGGTGEDVLVDRLRFDVFLPFVLGREGFTSGRHYWEVEVGGGRLWQLGVCRDSVRRKGRITRMPEEGYWAIEMWRGGKYRALTSPETPLPLSESPRAVGIFLDYEAGKVSFYDAENKSHLFTFSDPFSGPLWPLFCTFDDPLRIRPVPGWE
ncbi:butyrophilin subfamily 1 member A1-like [Rhinatrema bivittatum]|uniref:butyrophilin subfamily 1 member A1-like n=1 Tax=Rhinatrema bivittatum TaxID=194408 RepID=UPI0011298B74|nr:butyrophilin subfamily 1 member A1-like [Rhinatrema bivittatum]